MTMNTKAAFEAIRHLLPNDSTTDQMELIFAALIVAENFVLAVERIADAQERQADILSNISSILSDMEGR